MQTRTIPLKTPVQHGSETFSELTMRPAKAKDFRGLAIHMSEGGGSIKMGDMLNLAARLCSVPPSVIDELEPDDMQEVLSAVGGFTASGLRTG